MQCNKCKDVLGSEEASKKIKCDLCKSQICQSCSKLSVTEIRVLQLSKRYLKFFCPDCEEAGQQNKEDNKLAAIKEELQNDIQALKRDLQDDISKTRDELVILRESNIQLVHLLTNNDTVKQNPSYSDMVKTQTIPKKYQSTKTSTPNMIPKTSRNSFSNNINPINTNVNQNAHKLARRKPKKKGQIGTFVQTEEDVGFEGRAADQENSKTKQKKIWLFISRVKDHVEEDTISKFIVKKTKCKYENLHIKKLNTYFQAKDNKCFLVGVDLTLKEVVYQQDFWPKGVENARFDFRIGQHFLDNPNYV